MRDFCPAATCVLLKDTADGLTVLLLRRNPALILHGGLWVFPGGGVDPIDHHPEDKDPLTPLRRAAVRETAEEAGLRLDADALYPSARWFTPSTAPRQYDTRFFAAIAHEGQSVQIDRSEICDYRWVGSRAAIEDHQQGRHSMPPPVFLTLLRFSECPDAPAALSALAAMASEEYRPRIVPVAGGQCILYSEDIAYESLAVDHDGPRHRLWMIPKRWRYERSVSHGAADDSIQ